MATDSDMGIFADMGGLPPVDLSKCKRGDVLLTMNQDIIEYVGPLMMVDACALHAVEILDKTTGGSRTSVRTQDGKIPRDDDNKNRWVLAEKVAYPGAGNVAVVLTRQQADAIVELKAKINMAIQEEARFMKILNTYLEQNVFGTRRVEEDL